MLATHGVIYSTYDMARCRSVCPAQDKTHVIPSPHCGAQTETQPRTEYRANCTAVAITPLEHLWNTKEKIQVITRPHGAHFFSFT